MTGSEPEHFGVAVHDMRHVKVGDRVLRKFPSEHDFESGPTMTLTVTEVDNALIHCGPWTFDRATGMEVDHDLGWEPMYSVSGTFLVGLAPTTVDGEETDCTPTEARAPSDCE